MLTQRIIHYPALGQGAALRGALEERSKAANASGSPHSLTQRMFSKEAALIHNIRFDNLAAIQAYQARNASDEAFQTVTAKIGGFLSRPQETELYETLVSAELNGGTPAFTVRVKLLPAAGKGSALRKLLEARATKSIAGRLGAGLGAQMFAAEGPAYVVTHIFGSLAGVDEWRAANAKDPSYQSGLDEIAALTRAPASQEVLRILQPFPM
jgi:hypothetical protein